MSWINKTLEKSLLHKIEKNEVLALLEFKSNINDTETNMKATDVLHKQIKHLIMLIIEVLRREVSKVSGNYHNEKAYKQECLMLLSQGFSIAKWINNFNPESIGPKDITLPKDLSDFNSLVDASLSEIEVFY